MKIKKLLMSSTMLTSKGLIKVRVPALALWNIHQRLPDIKPAEMKWNVAKAVLHAQIEQASKVRY